MTAIISNLHFKPAPHLDVAAGLLGWIRVDVGPLRIDGIALRRTRRGELALAYPSRRDRQDREHTIVLPVSLEDEIAIERAVMAELKRRGEAQ